MSRKTRSALSLLIVVGMCILGFGTFVNDACTKDRSGEWAHADENIAPTDEQSSGGSRGITITVDASVSLGKRGLTEPQPISPLIYGHNLALWRNYTYDPNSIAWRGYSRMVPVTKALNVSIFRFPGGATINNVYFDHNNSLNWYEHVPQEWTYPLTNSWSNVLRADAIDYFMKFCKDVGAVPLMQVNQQIRNISQAAELVYYCNVEHNYNVRYWQIGNEPDIAVGDQSKRITDYMSNWRDYVPAMKAVDPTIEIMGPTPVSPNNVWVGYLLANDTKNVSYASFHYYPTYVGAPNPEHEPSIENLLQWSADGGASGLSSINWWADRMWNTLKDYNCSAGLAITEFSSVAGGAGNIGFGGKFGVSDVHAYAIYIADLVPRFGEWGVDIATQWELEAQDSASYTLINGIDRYPDSQGKYYDLRPAYYTYLLFSKFWGDVSIKALSSDEPNVGAHATLSSKDPNKLYVLIVNKEWWGGAKDVNVVLNGFTPSGAPAKVYELTADAIDSNDTTTLNGVRLDRADPETTLASLPSKTASVNGKNVYYTLPKLGISVLEIDGTYTPPSNTPPPVPTLITPQNGVTLANNRPWLNCSAVTDADGDKVEYEFVVDNNADFSSPEITCTLSAPSFPMNWKMPDGEYYWRVRAKDDSAFNSYSPWSTAHKFTIARALEFNTAPVVFATRTQPKDNSTVSSSSVNLKWNYRDWDGDKVKFDIYLDPIGAKTLYASGYEEPEFMNISLPVKDLYPGTTYYWRVVADDGYTSTEGPVWTFKTSGDATNRPPFVAQVAPANNAQAPPEGVHFEWLGQDLEGSAVTYKLYVDTTSASTLVYEGTATSYDTPLAEGVYYWRVTGSDGSSEGSSPKFKVIVRTNTPPTIELISPVNKGVVATDVVGLRFQGSDPDGQRLKYDVFIDKTDASTMVASGLWLPSFSTTLPDGTYKWKVVVSDGITTTTSPVWSFEMKLNAQVAPEIELLRPREGETVYTKDLTLEWFGTDANNDALTYTVFLDGSTGSTPVAQGLTTTSYTQSGIAEGNYKWKVSVSDGTHTIESGVANFTYKKNTPPSIALFFPPEGSEVTSNYTMLSWLVADPDAQELTYKIYMDNANATEILHEGKDNSYNTTLSKYKPYAWKVVVSDGVDTIESPIGRFSQKPSSAQSPPMVATCSPPEGYVVRSQEVILKWVAGDLNGDQLTYDVYADTTDGSTLVGTTTEMQYTLSGLCDKSTYKWKVVAKDASASADSGVKNFTIDLAGAPSTLKAPTPVSPSNNALLESALVTLTCTAEDTRAGTRYRFLVSSDAQFDTIVSNRTITEGVVTDQTVSTAQLKLVLMSGKYYWKAQLYGLDGKSPWSETREFTVQTTRTGVGCTLRAPTDGDVVRTTSARLYWDCPGKDTQTTFAVYVDKQKANIDSLKPDSCVALGISDTQCEVSGLSDGATYYWTVISIRSSAVSEPAQSRAFTTNIIQTVLLSPSDGMSIGRNWITLSWESSEGALDFDVYFDDSDGSTLYTTTGGHSMRITGLEDGKVYYWTIVPKLDGKRGICVSGVWKFSVHRDAQLVAVKSSAGFVPVGTEVTFTAENLAGLELVEYYFDFGDGTNSSWVNSTKVKHTYGKAGVYNVAVKARYSNGTETDWSDVAVVQVSESLGPSPIETIAIGVAIMVAVTVLVYLMLARRRKEVAANRKRKQSAK